MNSLTAIRALARAHTRRNTLEKPARANAEFARAVKQANLSEIPPALWNEIDAQLDHKPAFGLALARVAHEMVKRRGDVRVRATAALALVRAWNVCGEFQRALELCPAAARHFEKLDDTAALARVWLEAAWAHSYLGDLDQLQACLARVHELANAVETVSLCEQIGRKANWIQGRLLRQQGEYQAALELLEAVRQSYLRAGAQTDAHRVLREIGHTRARIKPLEAMPLLKTARHFFQRAKMAIEVAQCDHSLAQTEANLNHFQNALAHLRVTQKIYRFAQLDFFDACCALDLGYVCWFLNRYQEMLTYSQRAMAIFARLRAAQEVSSCEINIGYAWVELNQYPKALPFFVRARETALATGRKKKAAVCLQNIGTVYLQQGRYAQALEHIQRARAEFEGEGVINRLVECDVHLGRALYQLAQYDEALAALERAAIAARATNMGAWQAQTEMYRAQVWIAKGNTRAASASLQWARNYFARQGQRVLVAFCERVLASMSHTNKTRVLKQLAASRAVLEKNGQWVDAALCDVERGEAHLDWKEWRTARRYLLRAQQTLQDSFPDHSARLLYGLGRVAAQAGQPARALEKYVQAAQGLALVRGGLELETLSNSFFAGRQHVIQAGLRAARAQRAAPQALALIEAAKAQTFVHSLFVPDWHAPSQDPHTRALLDQEQQLRYQIAKLRQTIAAQPRVAEFEVTRAVRVRPDQATRGPLKALMREYEAVAQALRLKRRHLAGAPLLLPFALDEFRAAAHKRWGEQWLALNYYFDKDWLYLVCVAPQQVQLYAQRWTWMDRQMLAQCTDLHPDMRELVYNGTLRGSAAPRRENPLRYLHERLLPSDVQCLAKGAMLLIAPHQLLHQLCFQALESDDGFLGARVTVGYTPNLQAFTQLCASAPRASAQHALFCGVENFESRAPSLHHTRQEVNQARQRNEPSTVWWQENCTRARWLEWNRAGRLREFHTLHFATHATVELNAPHLSRILLGQDDLTILDVTQSALDARLVTLSACSSNLGASGSGDEWVSLARAFFYAGARALVASLWAVDDDSTARLMGAFYENLQQGQPIARALANAQTELRRAGASPYQWAPFVAIGDV